MADPVAVVRDGAEQDGTTTTEPRHSGVADAGAGEPVAESDRATDGPVTGTDGPVTGADRPVTATDGPATGADEPSADAEAPAPGDQPASPGKAAPTPRDRRAPRRWLTNSGTIALLTWLVATPVAYYIPAWADPDPFAIGASIAPIAGAFVLIILAFAVASRWSGEVVAGVAAGLAAAWPVLMLRTALSGTPFGFGGLVGDMGRMSASITRYTTTVTSSDTLVPSLPSEYPPFFAWLVGRVAVLLDQPAWTLLGSAQVLFMSASVLAAFLMWRRHVNPWVALAISAVSLIAWSDPRKAFEVITLALFVPWALEVFARPARKRMHWLWAGLIGGFIVMTYQAWIVYAAAGMIVLGVVTLRREKRRAAYLGRIGLIIAVAFAVSAWYVVPFVWLTLTRGGESISDLFLTESINDGLFPFLEWTPMGVLQLIGLVGLIWLWRSTWWAQPLLLLILGTYAYRFVSMLRFVATGHTGFMHYTVRLYGVLFAIAGILVLVHVAPIILHRLRVTPPRLAGAALLAVVLAWVSTSFTLTWMPETGGTYAVAAHTEPLPDGRYTRWAPKDTELRRNWFPVAAVEDAVERVTGPDPQRPTLAVDDRLFSYLPWPGYLDNDRTAGSTLSRWDQRFAEVQRIADVTDPAEFAAASRSTAFGPIDIFVLRTNDGQWSWLRGVSFSPEQFAPEHFTVVEGLPNGVVVAVRR
ncbi:arabinofuranosyltransferase [Polymorphospora lycopeni]|uniref:Galactan 5-O-arabinofuranosyltransferase n=1 Tax=Polymorphospora lycopeni TaxID=3140240 RepID=A0ABV5CLR7_9ACTN